MAISDEERKRIDTIIWRYRVEVIKVMKEHPNDLFFGWKEGEKKDER